MSERKASGRKKANKNGFPGGDVLLPSDDVELYAKHLEKYRARYSPSGPAELELVQRIADAAWCLDRIPSLEAELYNRGQSEFEHLHKDAEGQVRTMLIQAETFHAYSKEFRSLMTQEYRLERALKKDTAALKQLQLERSRSEGLRLRNVRNRGLDAEKFAFEFTA